MQTSEVLNLAADLIEERGWASGKGWSDNGDDPLCLEGAIAAAQGVKCGVGFRCDAYAAVEQYLGLNQGLWLWNDHLKFWHDEHGAIAGFVGGSKDAGEEYARTHVVEVLRATAVIEAARESKAVEVSA